MWDEHSSCRQAYTGHIHRRQTQRAHGMLLVRFNQADHTTGLTALYITALARHKLHRNSAAN